MRKIVLMSLTVLGLVCLAGCKKEQPIDTIEKPSVTEINKQASMPVLKTDNGYYYYSVSENGFRYVDDETKKEMFLCNKPECTHDGNAFCSATNKKYRIDNYCLYNSKLYVNAVESTDTQHVYKILTIELDGSELNEVCTYLTLEKTQQNPVVDDSGGFSIYKNKMLIPICVGGQGNLSDTFYFGAVVVDLETGEVNFTDEEPLSKENGKITNVNAGGEYFYYCEREGKQRALHRYHLTEKTDERLTLSSDFTGNYAVLEDNTIIYQKKQGLWLCRYDEVSGESEKKVQLNREEIIGYNGNDPVKNNYTFTPEQMKTDGEYIYVTEQLVQGNADGAGNYSRYIHIYNAAMEEAAVFNYLGELEKVEFEGHKEIRFFYGDLWWSGEDVICVAYQKENTDDKFVFHCMREDFLTGEPEFAFVYRYNGY